MHTQTRSAEALTPLSGWTVAAWVFFGLALIEGIVVGGWWLAMRPALADPHAGSAAELFALLGTGIAWMISLVLASLGTLCGLIGVARAAHASRSAWTALILNGAMLALSLVVLLTLSPR